MGQDLAQLVQAATPIVNELASTVAAAGTLAPETEEALLLLIELHVATDRLESALWAVQADWAARTQMEVTA